MRQLLIAGTEHENSLSRRASPSVLYHEVIDLRLRDYSFVAILLCVTHVLGLTQQSLWFDEGYTLTLATASDFHSFLRAFSTYTTSEHLQPLYYFLIYAWTRVVGISDFALRFPSAVASIISGLLVYGFSLNVCSYKNRNVALAIAVAFSISSYSVYYAQEARPYALVQCLSFAVVVLWFRRRYALHEKVASRKHRAESCSSTLFFSLIIAASCLVSIFTALLVFTLMTVDLARTRSAAQWRQLWLIPSLAGGCSIAAYGLFAYQAFPKLNSHDIVSIKQPLWMNAGYTLYGLTFGTTLAPASELLHGSNKLHVVLQFWPLLLPGALVLILIVAGTIRLLRQPDLLSHLTSTPAITGAVYVAVFLVFFGAIGHLNILPRHASSLFAVMVLLAATLAARLPEYLAKSRPGAKLLLAGAFGLVLCNVASLCRYKWNPALRKDEYRSVAQHLPHDGLPVFMVAGQPLLLQHYGVNVLSANEVDPPALADYLQRATHGTPVRLVINQYRGYRWDHSASPAVVIAPEFHCVQEQQLPYMDVERCSPIEAVLAQGKSEGGVSFAQ